MQRAFLIALTAPMAVDIHWVLHETPATALPGFSQLESRILAHRGVRDAGQAQAFLDRIHPDSTDPLQLLDMPQAVQRLLMARERDQRVIVYGDYDADGVTATVLLYDWLRRAGFRVAWYIPDRFQEGYGLNVQAVQGLHADGADLVVTVDCGVRSISEIELGRQLGLDFIVTDHHLPGPDLPPALAVLNPKREGDPYPFKGHAGVGVAYKLVEALAGALGLPSPEAWLDLVAVGTVADLAPLLSENRWLVSAGLERLRAGERPGLRALIESGRLSPQALTANSIAFGLAPRLNAAGRLATAGEAVDLLLSDQPQHAAAGAARLDALNQRRQRITEETVARVQAGLQRSADRNVVFAVDETFHEGVIGLAASRIVEQVYRPVVIMYREGELTKGSARSIPEFDITGALESCAHLLHRFGGHQSAAGFALPTSNLEPFRQRLEHLAAERLGETALHPSLELDSTVQLPDLDDRLLAFQDRLEPCGQDNPHPVFAAYGVEVLSKRAVGAQGRHLKLTVRQGERYFDAIAFRRGELAGRLPARVDLAFQFERNEYRGAISQQLNILDIRPAT